MTTKLADEYAEINKRSEEIKSERLNAIMGKPIEADAPEVYPTWPFTAPDDLCALTDGGPA